MSDPIEAARAAIVEAQHKVEALLQAADEAADAIGQANNLVNELDLPESSKAAIGHLGSDAYRYISNQGDGSQFEFESAKEHVDAYREIFETLVRDAPVLV